MNETQLVNTIKVLIAKGDKASDQAQQFYVAAGQHLKTLKEDHTGNWSEWETLLKEKCQLSTGRASELMQIADGRKTVAEIRATKAESVRKVRSRSSLRSEEAAEVAKDREEVRRLYQNVVAAERKAAYAADEVVTGGAIETVAPQETSKLNATPAPEAGRKEVVSTPDGKPASWKVVVIAKDGKRYSNGVRLETEEDADVYRMINVGVDFWRSFYDHRIVITGTIAIPTDDPPNVLFDRTKKGRIADRCALNFEHGTCGIFGWEGVAEEQLGTAEVHNDSGAPESIATPLATAPEARQRGLFDRATEAVRLAKFDSVAGLAFDYEIESAVLKAANAWIDLHTQIHDAAAGDDGDDDDDAEITNKDRRKVFLVTAAGAIEGAQIMDEKFHIKPNKQIVETARYAAEEWTRLADKMEAAAKVRGRK
jgi:hypothetical protein